MLGRRLWDAACLALLLDALMALALELGLALQGRNLVLAKEAGPLTALFGALPWLEIGHVAASILCAVFMAGCALRGARWCALAAAAAVASAADVRLLPVHALFFSVTASWVTARQGPLPGLAEFRWRNLGNGITDAALLGAACALALGLWETAVLVLPLTWELFSVRETAEYQALAAANGVVYGALRAAALCAALALPLLLLTRLSGRRQVLAPVILSCFFAGVVAFLPATLFFAYLKPELDLIDFGPRLFLGTVAIAAALGAVALRGYCRHAPTKSLRETSLAILRGALCPAILLLPARWHRVASIAFMGAALGFLIRACHPDLHDYSVARGHFYASVLVFLAMGVAVEVVGWTSRGPLLGRNGKVGFAIFLAAATGAALLASPSMNARVLLYEYTVVNRVFVEQAAQLSYVPKSRLGWTRPAEGELVLPPEEGATLPDPGIPLPPRPPIVVIVMDAMRPDRIGASGYRRPVTPNLDRLIRDSVSFDNGYTAASATVASIRALLTGSYSSRYLFDRRHSPYLTEDLAAEGYRAYVLSTWENIVNGIPLEPFFRSVPADRRAALKIRTISGEQDRDRARLCVRELDQLLREMPNEDRSQGWFVYLHLDATHFPWMRRDGADYFGESFDDLYDHNVAYSDAAVGILLDYLMETGLYDKAAIVLLSDHGTGLGDRGRYGGFFCYEEQIRVPLMVKLPGVRPGRVAEPVSLIDVAPTLLNLVKPGAPNRFHGVSLLPLITGRQGRLDRRALFCQCAFNDAYAVVYEGRWKYLYHRHEGYRQLFDLKTDPRERRNLVSEEPEMEERLRELLACFLWTGRDSFCNPYHFKDRP